MNAKMEIQKNGLDIRAIAPKNGTKYSPNLYAWLTTPGRKHRAWTSRVFRADQGDMYIGLMDPPYFMGSRLLGVLCNGRREQSWAYPGVHGLIEISDFWDQYVAFGRCAIDPGHVAYFVGDDARWKTVGDHRRCLWCGNHEQRLRHWVEKVQRSAWETVTP